MTIPLSNRDEKRNNINHIEMWLVGPADVCEACEISGLDRQPR